ncbi:hypothetical protein [Streptomyces sp. NPDC051909]|uniref:hypothetical protein n=1 Tax=Streptomyces sp. NPDC051909 TaxID=3154944 RepID=UPI00341E0136
MTDQSQEPSVSVLVADTEGVLLAEVRAGALHRLHRMPGAAAKGPGVRVSAVRHDNGLTVVAPLAQSAVPLLAGPDDGSAPQPVPGIPDRPERPDVNGVGRDGTALVTVEDRTTAHRLHGHLHALPWGAGEWIPVAVPTTFSLTNVVGTAPAPGSGGHLLYVTGATADAPGVSVHEMRPALFEVDPGRGTTTEVPLPGKGPERPLKDRLRLSGIDPAAGRLERGAFHRDVLVASASYGHAFEQQVLHAVDLATGRWSTARLREDDEPLDLWVTADGTARAVTAFGELWTSPEGRAWQRTRLAGLPPGELRDAAFTDGRLLLVTEAGAVLEHTPHGSGEPRTLLGGGGDRILAVVRPPAGASHG